MRRLIAAAPIMAALMLAAPGLSQAQTSTKESLAKDSLVVDLPADVATMDPQLQWDTDSYSVYRNIFDNLLTRDASGKIVPQVATAWHYTNDTTIVFDLRTDIVFHDGSRLGPDDVAFSINRIITPELHSSQLSQFDQITSAETSGPAQVTIHTKTPYPVLLAQLVKLSIVPKAYLQKVGDVAFNQAVIGSGPYKLKSWQHGVQTNLEANDAYWRGKPPFRSVTFRAVPDAATRIADLRTGRADITRGLSPDDAVAMKGEQGPRWSANVATERVAYLCSSTRSPDPTKDKSGCARPLPMAIDRDTLISSPAAGLCQTGRHRPAHPPDFGYVTRTCKGWPFNPGRAARKLVKEAGAEGAVMPVPDVPRL